MPALDVKLVHAENGGSAEGILPVFVRVLCPRGLSPGRIAFSGVPLGN